MTTFPLRQLVNKPSRSASETLGDAVFWESLRRELLDWFRVMDERGGTYKLTLSLNIKNGNYIAHSVGIQAAESRGLTNLSQER